MKEKLENDIARRMERLTGDSEVIQSLAAETKLDSKVSPVDLSYLLDFYRDLVSVTALVRVYNENYENSRFQELQGELDPFLEQTHKEMYGMLEVLIKSKGVEK